MTAVTRIPTKTEVTENGRASRNLRRWIMRPSTSTKTNTLQSRWKKWMLHEMVSENRYREKIQKRRRLRRNPPMPKKRHPNQSRRLANLHRTNPRKRRSNSGTKAKQNGSSLKQNNVRQTRRKPRHGESNKEGIHILGLYYEQVIYTTLLHVWVRRKRGHRLSIVKASMIHTQT